MIYPETRLNVADNSGVKQVKCIKILGGTTRGYGKVGSIIVVSVKKVAKGQKQKNIMKGHVCRAVVVRTKGVIRRENGIFLRFFSNEVVLIDNEKQPIGNRVFGPVPRELRQKKFLKILSIAEEVI